MNVTSYCIWQSLKDMLTKAKSRFCPPGNPTARICNFLLYLRFRFVRCLFYKFWGSKFTEKSNILTLSIVSVQSLINFVRASPMVCAKMAKLRSNFDVLQQQKCHKLTVLLNYPNVISSIVLTKCKMEIERRNDVAGIAVPIVESDSTTPFFSRLLEDLRSSVLQRSL